MATEILIDYIEQYRVAANRLWGLLDDIDTLSDLTVGHEVGEFERNAMEICAKRHEILETDGFALRLPSAKGNPYIPPDYAERLDLIANDTAQAQ